VRGERGGLVDWRAMENTGEARSRRLSGGEEGIELRLLEWSTEGVPMLLVHGFSNEAHIWDDYVPHVAPHYAVAALDQRGHGESSWSDEGRYDYESLVADVEAVVDQMGWQRLVYVGHSLGGRVGTLFAARHPERMAGFVLVDIAPELDARGSIRIRMDAEERGDGTFERPAQFETYLAHAYPAATPAAIARMARYGVRQRDDGRYVLRMDTRFRAGRGADDEAARRAYEEETQARLWDALAAIRCPTLVVRGAASDILSPEVADRMVEEVLPDGRLAVVPAAGHSVMTDNPDGFAKAVNAFVLG